MSAQTEAKYEHVEIDAEECAQRVKKMKDVFEGTDWNATAETVAAFLNEQSIPLGYLTQLRFIPLTSF